VAVALGRLDAATTLARHLLPEATETLDARLAGPRALLSDIRDEPLSEKDARSRAAALSPQDAFAAGRAFEQQWATSTRARASFVKAWAKAERKLARHQVAP
jgi:hypothetical protein